MSKVHDEALRLQRQDQFEELRDELESSLREALEYAEECVDYSPDADALAAIVELEDLRDYVGAAAYELVGLGPTYAPSPSAA